MTETLQQVLTSPEQILTHDRNSTTSSNFTPCIWCCTFIITGMIISYCGEGKFGELPIKCLSGRQSSIQWLFVFIPTYNGINGICKMKYILTLKKNNYKVLDEINWLQGVGNSLLYVNLKKMGWLREEWHIYLSKLLFQWASTVWV